MNPQAQSEVSRSRQTSAMEMVTLAGFCAFLFFWGLGSFGLVGADEPRYAQIAREMLARHDWITPVLNGQPWLEKPVFYYWGAMLSYAAFGVSDWAARVPTALLATLMVAAVYVFMRRFRAGFQVDAALMAASSAGVIAFARAASTDMPLAATFSLGMMAWFAWYADQRKLWLAAFYFFIALGMLAKGPVAPSLAAVIVVLFAVAQRDVRIVLRSLWLPGIAVFLVVALPWYVAVQLRNPGFLRVFILQHNLERFSTNLYRHKQPFWYYLPVLVTMLLPWTALALAGFVRAVRGWREREASAAGADLRRFLAIWAVAPVVFFSISQSKLPGYILPALLAWVLLLADYVGEYVRREERMANWLLAFHAATAGALLGAVLLAQYALVRARPPLQAWGVAAVVAAIAFVAVFWTLRSQGLRMLRLVTLAPVIVAVAFLVRMEVPVVEATQSARPVAAEIDRLQPGNITIAAFNVKRETEYGLNFYRNQPIGRYERGEVPSGDHLLVTRAGSEMGLVGYVGERRLSHVGSFRPQQIELYWVSSPTMHHHQP